MKLIIALLLFPILLLTAQPSMAIREGTATAEVFIKRYAQSGDFGRLALWHEAAAECLTRISVPMNEIAHAYYARHGYEKWVTRAEKEAQEIQKQYLHHRTSAEIAWQKFGGGAFLLRGFPDQRRGWVSQPVLNAERENIAQFIATWLPRYPIGFTNLVSIRRFSRSSGSWQSKGELRRSFASRGGCRGDVCRAVSTNSNRIRTQAL